MAARATHVVVGAAAGIGVYALFRWVTDQEITLEGCLVAGAAGACFGLIPDLLEPASDPNHRKFFHSLAAVGLLGYGNYKALASRKLTPFGKLAVGVCTAGYGSHLVLDSLTPRSLPLS